MYNVECSCGNVRPRASSVRRAACLRCRWCDPNGDPAGARGGKFWPVSDVNNSFWPVRTLRMRHGMRRGAYGAVLSALCGTQRRDEKPLPPRFPKQQLTISRAHHGARPPSLRADRSRSSQRAAAGAQGGRESPDPPSRVGMGNVRRGTDPTHACIVPSRQLSLRIRTVARVT